MFYLGTFMSIRATSYSSVAAALFALGFLAGMSVSPANAQPRSLVQASAPVIGVQSSPGEIAQALRQRRGAGGIDYAAQLRSAQLAFEAGDFEQADARLMKLSERAFLNSQAIELLYRSRKAIGQDSAAEQTLVEGIATYPHAVRLMRLRGEEALASGQSYKAIAASSTRYPESLLAELSALSAFRDGDNVLGLLEAERAAYLHPEGDELGQLTKRAIVDVYTDWLVGGEAFGTIATVPDSSTIHQTSPEPSLPTLTKAYARAMTEAAEMLRTSTPDTIGQLAYLGKLRAVTLRLFAQRGGLAKFPDPTLIDLYVLDRAGHLETATALQLGWMAPAELLQLEQTQPGRVLRTRTYMADDWRAAADAYVR